MGSTGDIHDRGSWRIVQQNENCNAVIDAGIVFESQLEVIGDLYSYSGDVV